MSRKIVDSPECAGPCFGEDLLTFLHHLQDNFLPCESTGRTSSHGSWASLRDLIHALEVNPEKALRKEDHAATAVHFLTAIAEGVLVLRRVH